MLPRRPGRPVVSIREDVVVKVQEPGASRRERLRTMAGAKVGARTGLFDVPRIVSFDDERGEIVFERLQLTWLREALADATRSMELVGRVARALAAIHGEMEPAPGALTADTATGGAGVPLHGDFGMRNVFHLGQSDQLAIIDWSNADWMGFGADIGPAEIDVAVFLMSLFQRRLFEPFPIARRREVALHFLTAYADAAPLGLDLDRLGATVAAASPGFNRLTRRRKGALLALGYGHSLLDLRLFLRRLPRRRFATRSIHSTG